MRTVIIGGGAAGLVTAATLQAADPKADVFLVERNDSLGKKVIISGGGRCNLTTGLRDVRMILAAKYPRGGKFLSSAMHSFPPAAVYDWFEEHGVPLKTEDDQRVFPRSDDGRDVVRVFERLFSDGVGKVHLLLNTTVEIIEFRTDGAKPKAGSRPTSEHRFAVTLKNQSESLLADNVVLTTGGQAYRQTGSTGDGYAFAVALGHSLTPLAPSLSALLTREKWPAEISGVSFEKATLTASPAALQHPVHKTTGPFLFTHRGLSGPAVFALSSLVAFERFDAAHPLSLTIDLFPDRTAEALTAEIENRMAANPTKTFQNALLGLIPKSLLDILFREANLPGPPTRAAEVSKKDVRRAVAWLKAVPLTAIGRNAGEEFVTAGGIPLSEVNPSTMESKICPGLYFAGEILDIDAFTGGFNLQSSWATGHLAGESIAAKSVGN